LNILITGANGFVGRHLVARLCGELTDSASITGADVRFDQAPLDSRLRLVHGSLAAPATLEETFDRLYDLVFHLATVPGGWAEADFEAGMQINLMLTIRILEALRERGNKPIFVYTSSIGVFGSLREAVNDVTPPQPTWSYGTHKAIGELLVADYTRKQFVDGRTVRLPAIVARGGDPSGAISAFMSDLIRLLANGKAMTCPVSKQAVCWWMSRGCAVDNILLASQLPGECFPAGKAFTLPALRCSIEEIVESLGRLTCIDTASLVTYQPVASVEERFGKLPPLHVPHAEAAGFRHDGTVDLLVERALEGLKEDGHV
jgi:nucleoside-diphosphate-sugar epimerase